MTLPEYLAGLAVAITAIAAVTLDVVRYQPRHRKDRRP